jgi:hypothetical protein
MDLSGNVTLTGTGPVTGALNGMGNMLMAGRVQPVP